jgi:hypothetical protein
MIASDVLSEVVALCCWGLYLVVHDFLVCLFLLCLKHEESDSYDTSPVGAERYRFEH